MAVRGMNWQRKRVSESLMWDREYLAIKTFRWGHYTYFFFCSNPFDCC